MKKNYFLVTLALLTCTVTSQQVLADEVWTTEEYNVVYHEDRNNTAIWHYGQDGVIFIDGLAGVYTDRGSYSGYWVQDSSSMGCDTYREGADGKPTYHWGRFEITFIDPDFPSRWQADISRCDGDPFVTLNGTPVTQ
ncbi:MAG: hypothetical protein F6K31_21580 [Symploca sp. SIO2G7]|nr:hypothetical protein [Symploca sp. SIO2G7]